MRQVLLLDIEALLPALGHERRTEVDADPRDVGFRQQAEELAAAATQVGDRLRARQLPNEVQVAGLLLTDGLGRAA